MIAEQCLALSRHDWDESERSMDFQSSLQVAERSPGVPLAVVVQRVRSNRQRRARELQALETENNQIIFETYGMSDSNDPVVPDNEITVATDAESTNRAQVSDLVSYAVGCMFGRYSLDKPGLILSDQGQTLREYLAQIPSSSFLPDADNGDCPRFG